MGAQCAHPHSIRQNPSVTTWACRRGWRQSGCLSRRLLAWERLAHLLCSYSVRHSEEGALFHRSGRDQTQHCAFRASTLPLSYTPLEGDLSLAFRVFILLK